MSVVLEEVHFLFGAWGHCSGFGNILMGVYAVMIHRQAGRQN
jgi:hypothetical protein